MYRNLFSPFQIGSLEIPNRIAMAPMGVEIVDADGHVREPLIAYYEERARGGTGLIITEVCAVQYPRGANSEHQMAMSSDEFLPGLRELTSRIHQYDTKIAVQLVHHGKVSRLDIKHGRDVIMPSIPEWHGSMSMGNDLTKDEIGLLIAASGGARPKLKEATRQDIESIVDGFADAAARAQRAGFDGVEIHAAHGYLISEFLSQAWNQRSDEYGGSLENRARLLCEVLSACKQRTGGNFPIWCRLDLTEVRTPNGIVFEDAKRVAQLAEAAGADAIHTTAYGDSTSGIAFTEGTLVHKEAAWVEMSAEVKKLVTIPVIAVGRIEPEVADKAIRDGKIDAVSMARKMLADPHIARKLEAGKPQDVRPCIYCYTCVAQAFFDRRVKCAVNPVTANEAEHHAVETTAAATKKRVVVVGGGPSGLEAARVAALRGHDVTLFEKGPKLGGTLRFASLVYEPNERLLKWLIGQVESLGVDVRLGTEATPATLREIAPDALVVAVGPSRGNPDIPGIDSAHVFDGDDLRGLLTGDDTTGAGQKLGMFARIAIRAGRAVGVTGDPSKLRQASKAYMPVGKRVAVVGGGLVGCELAEFMHDRGREVIVLEEAATLATEMAHPRRWRVLHELREHGVELVANATVKEITDAVVRFEVAGAGAGEDTPAEQREFAADTVIVATGLAGNPELVKSFEGLAAQTEVIGDCTGVSYLEGAMHDGWNAGARI
ncbi:MAG: FAD-dependent oxidoreductase [Myxococcota bacterium]|nr:FAD-dependent oxidoreductase [Myxococcota bacterium]